MDGQENLSGIAEVAVALAGFSGLFAALRHGGDRVLTEIERNALIRLLTVSLGAAILSLAPTPLLLLGVAEPTVWDIGCLLLGAFTVGALAWIAATRPVVRFPKLLWLMLSLTLGVGAFQFGSVADLFALPSSGVFAAGLWWLIVISALQFLLQAIASTRT